MNLFIPLKIFNSYIDFYPNSSNIIEYNNSNQRYFEFNGNIYINNCDFTLLSIFYGHGGAIYCFKKDTQMVIENCLFYKCEVWSGHGGAIYFECVNSGSSILSKVCGSRCSADDLYSYQFAMLYCGQEKINECHFVSYSFNYFEPNLNRFQSFRLWSGHQQFVSVNCCRNYCLLQSGVRFQDPQSVSMRFSSIINNTSGHSIVFRFVNGHNSTIYKSNFIDNIAPLDYGVCTIWEGGEATFNECSFLKNNKNGIGYLFVIIEGIFNLNNCVMDYFTYKGPIPILNNLINSTNSLNLTHFNTIICII